LDTNLCALSIYFACRVQCTKSSTNLRGRKYSPNLNGNNLYNSTPLYLDDFGDWLGTLSERLDDDVEKELVGFLLSSGGPSPAGKVAEYLNVSSKHAIKTFFKAKSKGMLKEFTFDPDNKEIIPPALQAQTVTERPTVSSMSTIADELLKGAKLKELEKLKMSGKISEEAYRELRKEIEGT